VRRAAARKGSVVRRCDRAAAYLPAALDGEPAPDPHLARHVESCIGCQAELARYRRVARLLGQLRHECEELPPGLVADVLTSVERAARRRAARRAHAGRRAALAGGVAAALAAAGVAAASLARHQGASA